MTLVEIEHGKQCLMTLGHSGTPRQYVVTRGALSGDGKECAVVVLDNPVNSPPTSLPSNSKVDKEVVYHFADRVDKAEMTTIGNTIEADATRVDQPLLIWMEDEPTAPERVG